MAQKYYNVKETAGKLSISEAEVKQMLERRELYGYRDGADWKFKVEDIEKIARERKPPADAPAGDDEGDVLLSEIELGQSDPGLSGTVIGVPKGKPAPDSDIQIGESDIKLAESDIRLADSDIQLESKKPAAGKKAGAGDKASQFEELDLTLDQDLALEDSDVALGPSAAKKGKKDLGNDSAVDLSGKALDDDDLVLGGSGTGSDITIGGDSGISLVDPADSGLSLEEPLNLNPATDESLELGEDDLLSFSAEGGSAALKSEDDFQLTPLEEAADADESDSGSQVIALDTEGDEAATLIAGGGGVAAMLEEDLSTEPGLGAAPLGPAGAAGSGIGLEAPIDALGTAMLEPAALLPEAPYSIWNVLSLVVCSLVLILVGMMMYDLLRNMWSWDSNVHVQPLNSSIIDTLLNLFEK